MQKRPRKGPLLNHLRRDYLESLPLLTTMRRPAVVKSITAIVAEPETSAAGAIAQPPDVDAPLLPD